MKITKEMLDAADFALAGSDAVIGGSDVERIIEAVAPLILEEAGKEIAELKAALRDGRKENNRLGEMLHAMRDEIDQILRRSAN